MQVDGSMELEVLSTPGHLISLAARGFARLSEARLKPLGFGVGYLPVLVALKNGRAETQRHLARFAKIEQPSMAQMLVRMERDGLIRRAPDPADGRSSLGLQREKHRLCSRDAYRRCDVGQRYGWRLRSRP